MQLRQTWALVYKDLLLLFSRKSAWSTVFRAGFIPIVVALYLTVVFRIYWPQASYGIGSPTPVRTLVDAMNVGETHQTLVILNNASSIGGDIDRVIEAVVRPVRDAGKPFIIVKSTEELRSTCRPSLQGTTKCFAGVVFHSSPSEGPGELWNYTLRGDASFGLNRLDVRKTTNDGEVYIYPLQRAIDSAIAGLNSTNGSSALPPKIEEYLFTSKTEKEWKDSGRLTIIQANINFASVVWLLSVIGVTFQLVTLMAKERETEMSDLIECMMPNKRRWEPQAIRFLARHIAFDITYAPSWVLLGLFLKAGYYKLSSVGIPIIGMILIGLSLTSCSILGAAFFKRAQLSSITVVGLFIMLAIIAQITSKNMGTIAVVITGLLFTPMAFVNYLITCARWEKEKQAISLTKRAPGSPWNVPAIAFWIFFVIQTVAYPILAMFVERWFYGTAASRVQRNSSQHDRPIVVEDCTRIYQHSWLWNSLLSLFGKKTDPVIAIKNVSLSALKGQVMVLVGANGCGKTTILNGIVGLGSMTSGKITVDGSSGIGICPQKNVLWNALTVQEHARIFNRLKATDSSQVGADLAQLFKTCGLEEKMKTPSRNLSGGQKRKLQLLMMLTGGSRVCCVDEASGGLDPLSRRKIWDVLLAERGSRTVILTTHFLDEAEFLADNMVIMHQGEIKAAGSVSELKSKLGNGYRIHIIRNSEQTASGQPETFEDEEHFSEPAEALARVKELEAQGVTNYQIAGPTIEEVFMNLAADKDAAFEENTLLHPSVSRTETNTNSVTPFSENPSLAKNDRTNKPIVSVSVEGPVDRKESHMSNAASIAEKPTSRKEVGAFRQLSILFGKRFIVFQRNPAPLLLALIVPIIAAGLISVLIKGVENPGCSLNDQFSTAGTTTLSAKVVPQFLVGPQSVLSSSNFGLLTGILPTGNIGPADQNKTLLNSVRLVNSIDEFYGFTNTNFSTINPGGIYLGDSSAPPTFNIRSDIGIVAIFSGVLLQNALNVLLSGVRIVTQYTVFDFAWPSATTETIQFVFYFGLVMAAYPAFFTLYICQERLRGIKAMEYSNGVRPFPLWSAYTLFDWAITTFSTILITIIFATATKSAWYGIGYLFVVFLLYGLAAVLLSYIISSYAKSQFSAFAFSAGGQW
jgi:ATP-binding cassette subfamily A (ABC1) protein 3